MTITDNNVFTQQQRFDAFIKSTNLVKIGQRYMWFMRNNAEDGRFTPYCYLLRILRLVANVSGCYSHPEQINKSYRDLLEYEALNAYINSIPSK